MKILLLTPVDPVNNAIYYNELLKYFDKKEVELLSIPFFANTYAMMNEANYLPSLFAMFKSMTDERTKKTVLSTENYVVIGNSYNTEKFDMILSLGDESDNIYIKMLEDDIAYKEFKLLCEPERLYKWEDAEFNLPTIEHAILFLEGVYKKDEQIQRKTRKSN